MLGYMMSQKPNLDPMPIIEFIYRKPNELINFCTGYHLGGDIFDPTKEQILKLSVLPLSHNEVMNTVVPIYGDFNRMTELMTVPVFFREATSVILFKFCVSLSTLTNKNVDFLVDNPDQISELAQQNAFKLALLMYEDDMALENMSVMQQSAQPLNHRLKYKQISQFFDANFYDAFSLEQNYEAWRALNTAKISENSAIYLVELAMWNCTRVDFDVKMDDRSRADVLRDSLDIAIGDCNLSAKMTKIQQLVLGLKPAFISQFSTSVADAYSRVWVLNASKSQDLRDLSILETRVITKNLIVASIKNKNLIRLYTEMLENQKTIELSQKDITEIYNSFSETLDIKFATILFKAITLAVFGFPIYIIVKSIELNDVAPFLEKIGNLIMFPMLRGFVPSKWDLRDIALLELHCALGGAYNSQWTSSIQKDIPNTFWIIRGLCSGTSRFTYVGKRRPENLIIAKQFNYDDLNEEQIIQLVFINNHLVLPELVPERSFFSVLGQITNYLEFQQLIGDKKLEISQINTLNHQQRYWLATMNSDEAGQIEVDLDQICQNEPLYPTIDLQFSNGQILVEQDISGIKFQYSGSVKLSFNTVKCTVTERNLVFNDASVLNTHLQRKNNVLTFFKTINGVLIIFNRAHFLVEDVDIDLTNFTVQECALRSVEVTNDVPTIEITSRVSSTMERASLDALAILQKKTEQTNLKITPLSQSLRSFNANFQRPSKIQTTLALPRAVCPFTAQMLKDNFKAAYATNKKKADFCAQLLDDMCAEREIQELFVVILEAPQHTTPVQLSIFLLRQRLDISQSVIEYLSQMPINELSDDQMLCFIRSVANNVRPLCSAWRLFCNEPVNLLIDSELAIGVSRRFDGDGANNILAQKLSRTSEFQKSLQQKIQQADLDEQLANAGSDLNRIVCITSVVALGHKRTVPLKLCQQLFERLAALVGDTNTDKQQIQKFYDQILSLFTRTGKLKHLKVPDQNVSYFMWLIRPLQLINEVLYKTLLETCASFISSVVMEAEFQWVLQIKTTPAVQLPPQSASLLKNSTITSLMLYATSQAELPLTKRLIDMAVMATDDYARKASEIQQLLYFIAEAGKAQETPLQSVVCFFSLSDTLVEPYLNRMCQVILKTECCDDTFDDQQIPCELLLHKVAEELLIQIRRKSLKPVLAHYMMRLAARCVDYDAILQPLCQVVVEAGKTGQFSVVELIAEIDFKTKLLSSHLCEANREGGDFCHTFLVSADELPPEGKKQKRKVDVQCKEKVVKYLERARGGRGLMAYYIEVMYRECGPEAAVENDMCENREQQLAAIRQLLM